METHKLVRLLIAVLICEIIGNLGIAFVLPTLVSWYPSLNKPSLTPPTWAFAPIWIVLYALMGISLYLMWNKGLSNKKEFAGIALFFVQLVLNFIWTLAFFGLRSPLYGFIMFVLLFLATIATIIEFVKVSKSAAIILLPYLAWLFFVGYLNLYILILG